MKKLLFFGVLALILFAGCKTQQSVTTSNNDDVYYSRPKHTHSPRNVAKDQDLTAPQALASADTQAMASASAATSSTGYDNNDYSARIKRFHHPEQGAGYYDETYTNPANYDSTASYSQSSSPDVNIYINGGYDPFWGSGMSWGWNYGWGGMWDYGWGNPWYSPYYSWYYPYGMYSPYYSWWYSYDPWFSYWFGYWDGYADGYWHGHHNWWNEGYSAYYGPRRNLTPGIGGPVREPNTRAIPGQTSLSQRNERTVPANTRQGVIPATRSDGKSGTVAPKVTPGSERYFYSRPAARQNKNYNRAGNAYAQRQKATPRYVRPENNNPGNGKSETQIYSSPSYRQPKSSQEYLAPRSQGTVRNQQGTGNTRQNYTVPSGTQRRYTQPSYNNTRTYSSPGTRSYSQPSRSYSPGYSAPSRTISPGYSSPSRSGGSYSSPSRSGGGSYSAPSRSSGGSYSAPSRSESSGSSSGGRRR